MKVNERIHARRKELGLTLEDVGQLVGVGKSTVRKWETGDIANMRRDKIAQLAIALRMSPAELIDWDTYDNGSEYNLELDKINSIPGRLRFLRETYSLSRNEVAQRIGASEAYIEKFENDAVCPEFEVLARYCYAFAVSSDFILGLPSDISEAKITSANLAHLKWGEPILDKYKAVEQPTQKAVCAVLGIPHVSPEDLDDPPVETKSMLVYSFPAAAGVPLYAEDDFEHVDIPVTEVPRGADFGIRIRGDSMMPIIEDGSIVWVHKQQDLQNGQIGIFMLHDEAVCKRFYKDDDGIRLESENKVYQPIIITDYENFGIVGRVIERFRL